MSFAWPLVLVALLAAPLLVAGYVWIGRRRRRAAVSYSSVALIRAARPATGRWRRHVPFALVLAALVLLGLAVARPQVRLDVPVSASSVILALDVSGSMCATDVEPNRLSAAQTAMRDFVHGQGSSTRIGLVAFSSFAQLAVAPTTDHDRLLAAIDALTTGRGTTIGSAILKSVDAISQINPGVVPADGPAPAPPAPGRHAPEIVVLLTDGANTTGVTPVEAARVAAARGVRVYPIGFGTTNPTQMVCTAKQLGGTSFENFGGRFGGAGRPGAQGGFLRADEPTLRQVATITGGTYYAAKGADQLQGVLKDLPRQVRLQQREIELGGPLAGLAALLVLLAVAAATRWSAFP